jgi:iron complex outermembrane receptor protein
VAGSTAPLGKHWSVSATIGYASRRPRVNELFSNGLHQGVSGIEEGDLDLNEEKSVKGLLTLEGKVAGKITISATGYLQSINDYIYLAPQDEVRLTIRGAFPVFRYEQDDARIAGLDLKTSARINSRLEWMAMMNLIEGFNRSEQIPLVNMPANSLYTAVDLSFPDARSVDDLVIQVNFRYVAEQKNLLEWQDFVTPPPAYALVGLMASAEKPVRSSVLSSFIRIDNLLNSRYRDYLNRQRYFADEPGINITIGTKLVF